MKEGRNWWPSSSSSKQNSITNSGLQPLRLGARVSPKYRVSFLVKLWQEHGDSSLLNSLCHNHILAFNIQRCIHSPSSISHSLSIIFSAHPNFSHLCITLPYTHTWDIDTFKVKFTINTSLKWKKNLFFLIPPKSSFLLHCTTYSKIWAAWKFSVCNLWLLLPPITNCFK